MENLKLIPKYLNSGKIFNLELNKRKQLFLNLNGIKVKIDGSWGPWLELLYRRLTTKNKHYNATPLGFMSYLYDKTLGDGTTYQEEPASVKGYSGEIKQDNRSSARRYIDQLMQNNKTPLGYVTLTILPSAIAAGTLVYGSPAIISGARTAISNPSTILPATKTLVKEGIKGIAGATAVNATSKATTGKTWGELVAQSTGVSSGLGEFTNPGFVLGSQAHNIVRRPILAGRAVYTLGKDIYTSGKDLIWLAKAYNKVGTGLKNPYVRNKFLDLAKHPSISRNFIETYSRNSEAGLNYSLIKEALPLLKKLLEEFNMTPLMYFKDYETVTELVEGLRNALQYAKNLSNRYTRELEFLKDKNEILYNIAKESPLYQLQIVNDLKNGKITDVEEYVKNLIKLSNTFLRRMNLKSGQDFTEAFSKIKGRSFGRKDFSMDVGNQEVVFDPIWSRGYGNDVAIYSPKEIKLNGPIETWWSQRKPIFQDKSIYIDTEGMHTGNSSELLPVDILYNINKYIKSAGIPRSYGRTASHMIFLSPNKGASIADLFIITPGNPNIRYTLGYKNGGKL